MQRDGYELLLLRPAEPDEDDDGGAEDESSGDLIDRIARWSDRGGC